MRGRTFLNKFLIIDEAQNLTPKQMKTLITRAGPGTKVVCLGNIAQIDTPYLTEGSSGLTFVVDRFQGAGPTPAISPAARRAPPPRRPRRRGGPAADLTPESGVPSHFYIVQRGKIRARETGQATVTSTSA